MVWEAFDMGAIDITFLANLVGLCLVKCHFFNEFISINKNTCRKVHWMILLNPMGFGD